MKKPIITSKGFTLIETIIVIAIFCLIITVIYSIYVLNQKAYIAGENMGEITQNGRVILERVVRELRQAKKIITELPDERSGAPSQIEFLDGHDVVVSLAGNCQSASLNTIILDSGASAVNDYYKDLYIKILNGSAQGQIKKVYSYNGATKTATIEGSWVTIPGAGASYKIDSNFYYMHYYKDSSSIYRETYTYCFSSDSQNCTQPETYVAYNSTPPPSQQTIKVYLEQPRVIGEYVNSVEFWGSSVINIFLELKKGDKIIDLESKVFGRNL